MMTTVLCFQHAEAVAATHLVAAIDRARRVTLQRFLLALGIPMVGPATARQLGKRFHTLAAFCRAPLARLAATPGVGPAAARDITGFLRQPSNQAVINALLRHGVTIAQPRAMA